MASKHVSSSPFGGFLVLLALSLGALLGIGAAAALLSRPPRPQPEDPDAPLFI